jgi:hypothetical protein
LLIREPVGADAEHVTLLGEVSQQSLALISDRCNESRHVDYLSVVLRTDWSIVTPDPDSLGASAWRMALYRW